MNTLEVTSGQLAPLAGIYIDKAHPSECCCAQAGETLPPYRGEVPIIWQFREPLS